MATGFHGFHVIIGTIFLIVCLIRANAGQFTPEHHLGFEFAAWYWHFVDVVWLFLFASIYVWGSWGVPIAPRRLIDRLADLTGRGIGCAPNPYGGQPWPSRTPAVALCRRLCLPLPALRRGPLFEGYPQGCLDAAKVCGLDLTFADSGEVRRSSSSSLSASSSSALAAVVEALFHPPPYVHLMLWIPATHHPQPGAAAAVQGRA